MAGTRNKQVGSIEYKPANIKVPLVFDSKERMFHVTYAGTPYSDVNARDLEATVLAAIKNSLQVTWLPIIEITPVYKRVLASFPDEDLLGIELDRRYIASFPNVGYKTVHWGCPPDDRIQVSRPFGWDEKVDGPFALPTSKRHHAQLICYHAYSETLWNQLQAFREVIRLLRTQLLTALQTEAGITTFSAAFVALLAPQRSVAEEKLLEQKGQ
jgi:hypothetical protein